MRNLKFTFNYFELFIPRHS